MGPGARVVLRSVVYYAVLIDGDHARLALSTPRDARVARVARRAVRRRRSAAVRAARDVTPLDEATLAITVALAMIAAVLLSLPVAWVYTLTRAKRGYQQSVVQLLIMLPVVVAGIVVLVKYSVALAFSLGGIVAAVRFRNTLDDSKDAVYVFLVTGVGHRGRGRSARRGGHLDAVQR